MVRRVITMRRVYDVGGCMMVRRVIMVRRVYDGKEGYNNEEGV